QDSQDTFESSDDNTNVVNAPREPIVVTQDPGEKSSQDPPLIDQNCCYECGDSLDGIFCRQCICKSRGKGAHFGYNCPPKDSIISKPEPYNRTINETINEIPQTLPSLDSSCFSLPHVSKPNIVDDSPNVFTHPPQLQIETYWCELCGNNAHYDSNEWGREVRKKEQAYEEEKYSAACRYMLSVTCDDDEDDYIPLAITTDLPIEEPDNSLNIGMEDEHLDTIPATESDEVIKSSVEEPCPNPK
ncbi:hypothetical protein Tco_1567781, partial [Tanacetum coccineum]